MTPRVRYRFMGLVATIWAVLVVAIVDAGAQNKPTVTRDRATGDYLVEMLVDGTVRQWRYTPATKLEFRVRCKVASTDGGYTYDYTFENGATSRQDLHSVTLIASMPARIAGTPAEWEPNHIESIGRLYWYRIPHRDGPLEGIPPGSRLSGFSVMSEFLPGPVEMRGRGNVGDVQLPADTTAEMLGALDDVMRHDWVVSQAIGPAVPHGLNEPELTPEVHVSRVRITFSAALLRSKDAVAQRIEESLRKAVQALESGQVAEGRRYLEDSKKDARALTASPWLLELGDALRMNLDHIDQRFWPGQAQDPEDLRRRHGLHAAARASEGGHYVGIEMIEVELVAADLETVAQAAEIVVRGTIGRNLTRVAPGKDGRQTVVLDYLVDVDQVFKGPESLMSEGLILTIPGGRYEFGDGASVEILTPGFRKPGPDEEYVLFLRKDPLYGQHVLAFGTQSLFRLNADGSVETQSGADCPSGRGILTDRRDAFLQRVTSAARTQ